MNIAVDSGNTYAKIGWFDDDKLIRFQARVVWDDLVKEIRSQAPDHIIFSSVSNSISEFKDALGLDIPVLDLSPDTPLPISKNYKTPETLGADRIAAATGAQYLFPDKDLLIIDMGTCITYDYLDHKGSFEGGLISPGVKMRFNALHTFTKRLPQLEPVKVPELIGKSTREAIESGVMNGVLGEVEGIIERYRHISPSLSVVLCGGDTTFFESSLKPAIFVVPELVLIGLNRILRYNVAL
ncbi:type III pantothenate kinase [Dyadobacter sp. CY312]|uniref:type III pantothenate kinase n=1 Tax=Dyadobacter sp. CY312 TaxID=2907303 RepID=UPI001F3C3877|nr:type III pantothenate kinase [Dyadobacter sp. CY312]MCE7040965.1 type III pantothenate kinase [Dyadobacter sp. CY312]